MPLLVAEDSMGLSGNDVERLVIVIGDGADA
jgi:hypothetical protein